MAFGSVFVFVFSFVVHLTTGEDTTFYRPQFHCIHPRKETFVGPPYAIVKYHDAYHVWHEINTNITNPDEGESVDSAWGYETSSNLLTWHSGRDNELLKLGPGGGAVFVNDSRDIILLYAGDGGIFMKASSDGVQFTQKKLQVPGEFRNPVALKMAKDNSYWIVARESSPNAKALKLMRLDGVDTWRVQSTNFFTFSSELFLDGEVPSILSFDFFKPGSLERHYVLLVTVVKNETFTNGFSSSMYWTGVIDEKQSNGVVEYKFVVDVVAPRFMDHADAYGFRAFVDGDKVKALGAVTNTKYNKKSLPFTGGLTFPRVLVSTLDYKNPAKLTLSLTQSLDDDVLQSLRCVKCDNWRQLEKTKLSLDLSKCECPMSKVTKQTTLIEFKCSFELQHNPGDFKSVVTLSSLHMDEVDVGYNVFPNGSSQFVLKRMNVPYYFFEVKLKANRLRPRYETATIHGLLDANSLELFLDDGEVVMTALVYPKSPIINMTFTNTNYRSERVYRLRSALVDMDESGNNEDSSAVFPWSSTRLLVLLVIIMLLH